MENSASARTELLDGKWPLYERIDVGDSIIKGHVLRYWVHKVVKLCFVGMISSPTLRLLLWRNFQVPSTEGELRKP